MKTNMASEYSHLVLFMCTVLMTHTSVCEHICMYTCLYTCTYILYKYMYIHIIYTCMLSTTVITSKIIILNISLLITFFRFSKWLILVFSHHLFNHSDQIRSDQPLSCVRLFATPWIAARQASLSITNSQSSLRLTSMESVMPSSHLILCCSLFLLPPIPPSIRVTCSSFFVKWLKVWLINNLFEKVKPV